MDFIRFESDHGTGRDVDEVRHRALQTLDTPEARDKFKSLFDAGLE